MASKRIAAPPGLHIAPGLVLPPEAAAARFVAIAKSGFGKTNFDAVLAELFVRVAGVPTIVMDPIGNMYGLRSSADGESAGLPMAIFGGPHGDVPLPFERATYIADLLAEGVSAVLDLRGIPNVEDFAAIFLPRLLARVQGNMHVIFEEGHRFARNTGKSNAVTQWCQAARNVGIGWTFSTQKPQSLHHDVTDTANVFVAMRMSGELAQEAIGNEIGSRIGKKAAAKYIADLPTLQRGEAWVIPDSDWLDDGKEWEPQRVRFRLRETFEVKPPKPGQARREPKVLADVDFARLRSALTIAPGVDTTPEPLVESAPRSRRAGRGPVPLAVAAPSKNSSPELLALTRDRDAARALAERNGQEAERYRREAEEARGALAIAQAVAKSHDKLHSMVAALAIESMLVKSRADKPHDRPQAAPAPTAAPKRSATATATAIAQTAIAPAVPAKAVAGMRGGQSRMLTALARCGGSLSSVQLATLADVNRGSGTFYKYLNGLVSLGYATADKSQVVITKAGAQAIGVTIRSAPPTTKEIVAIFAPKLRAGERRILDLLVASYPREVKKDDLATRSEVNRTSGTFYKYLGRLVTNGLADVTTGTARASDTLFVSSR